MRQSYAYIPIPCTGSYSFSPPCHKHFPASILYIKIRVPPLIIARSVPSTPKYLAILFYRLGKVMCLCSESFLPLQSPVPSFTSPCLNHIIPP